MKNIPGKELARALERHGWRLLQGSHHIYGKAGSIVRLSVPVFHGNQPLKSGLLNHLLKMAGLNENDL